jgi:hypothetical protein
MLSLSLAGPGEAPPADTAAAEATAPAEAEAPTTAEDNGWDTTEAPAETAPAETAPTETAQPTAQPQPPPPQIIVVQPASQPPAQDKPPPRSSNAGTGMVIGGALLTGFGAASLLLIAAPAAIVKDIALSRAEDDALIEVSSRRDHYERARRADDVMEGAFWTGVVMVGVGVPLLITGVVIRNRARREVAERLQLDASGVTVRF